MIVTLVVIMFNVTRFLYTYLKVNPPNEISMMKTISLNRLLSLLLVYQK